MKFHDLTNTQKGTVFITIGIALLLYILGIFKQAFYFVIIIAALFLIIYGFIIGNFWKKINGLILQYRKK